MELTDQDLALIEDSDFLLAKVQVIAKLTTLMEKTRSALQTHLGTTDFVFPSDINLSDGKIARGESYKQLPYLVLDYPAVFTKHNIFAFRTMFWWGNFLSVTLHLQGDHFEVHRDNLADNIELLLQKDFYLCVGNTPWEYHYQPDNYELLQSEHAEQIKSGDFLKLSRRLELDEWQSLPEFSKETLALLLAAA